MSNKTTLHIEAEIAVPVEKAWEIWTTPEHITKWNQASPDWHCPSATNDLQVGGKFSSTMAAKDGSFSFEFGGVYDTVNTNELIEYTLDDGRTVSVTFEATDKGVLIKSDFEPEDSNSHDMQQGGWQAILNSYKAYAESIA
ncbi:SRPBCC domain-containing protein [Marinoscillum pacificum]|uniref:SRPBCC domain-containing protein n=1 Tax=Marinoscillum pacificum TaxID=392723 RepID=UPI0021581286|nr:SRPBCC domain-containing protein [Marinoscillum pacificum]